MHDVDDIIVGQGIAGTTLAWQLHWRGHRIAIIDRHVGGTASLAAAGLITPVTGQRFVPSWRFDTLWKTARDFYQRVEAETQSELLALRRSLKLFRDRDERSRFELRTDVDRYTAAVELDSLRSVIRDASLGGVRLQPAAQLDVPAYLQASHEFFRRHHTVIEGDLNPDQDLQPMAEGIAIARYGLRAARVSLCVGYAAQAFDCLQAIRFDPAQGEMLTIRIPNLQIRDVLHRGIWLAPASEAATVSSGEPSADSGRLFKVGATYDRERLDGRPSAEGRSELLAGLSKLLQVDFEVVDQQAAVRPIVVGRHPVVGFHPHIPRCVLFNGLASKGALQAPWMAEQLVRSIAGRSALDPTIDVQRRFRWSES